MQIAVKEAKNKFSTLGKRAHSGERIVVTRNGKPWFDIVPHKPKERKITPLRNVQPTITLEEAIAPVTEEDLPGWI